MFELARGRFAKISSVRQHDVHCSSSFCCTEQIFYIRSIQELDLKIHRPVLPGRTLRNRKSTFYIPSVYIQKSVCQDWTNQPNYYRKRREVFATFLQRTSGNGKFVGNICRMPECSEHLCVYVCVQPLPPSIADLPNCVVVHRLISICEPFRMVHTTLKWSMHIYVVLSWDFERAPE